MRLLVIFPTQLFRNISYIKEHKINKIYIYEEPKFFTKFKYHKLKLLYHRVTCKEYQLFLQSRGFKCKYIDFYETPIFDKNAEIYMVDPIDHELTKKYKKKCGLKLHVLPSQHFTLSPDDVINNQTIFYKNDKFNHSNFYKWQRRRLNILVDRHGQPATGKWTYDAENRKKISKDIAIPGISINIANKSQENITAKKYIDQHFPHNYGEMNLIYPITHQQAKKWLTDFTKNKLYNFGKYQDASLKKEPFLFHSVLTPAMNIGLLTDWDVLAEVLKYRNKVPFASLEGFIRQIIGWRNYVYAIYILAPDISQSNFFKHKNRLPDTWWSEIGVEPIDDIIQNKIVKYAYTHHIERLMYLGSFMLMSRINPKEVYRYFMEWAIDAYEWVMIPNVFGMSQYADGGKMMRRPYISSSNYILKMSNYKHGDWCDKWDQLYHEFLRRNHAFFKKSYFYRNSLV